MAAGRDCNWMMMMREIGVERAGVQRFSVKLSEL